MPSSLPDMSRSRQRRIVSSALCHCFSGRRRGDDCSDGRREGRREGDDCGGVFMDYYSESDESVDHKVMASIHSTPTGLTAHECDYRGKTVYLALITAAGNALYCFPQSSHFV